MDTNDSSGAGTGTGIPPKPPLNDGSDHDGSGSLSGKFDASASTAPSGRDKNDSLSGEPRTSATAPTTPPKSGPLTELFVNTPQKYSSVMSSIQTSFSVGTSGSHPTTHRYLDPVLAYELRGSVFVTDQFDELFFTGFVAQADVDMVWQLVTTQSFNGGAEPLYDDVGRQWSLGESFSESEHFKFLERVQAAVSAGLGGRVHSIFKASPNTPLEDGEARHGRKPDAIIVHRGAKLVRRGTKMVDGGVEPVDRETDRDPGGDRHSWKQVRVVGQLKSNRRMLGHSYGIDANAARMVIELAAYVREMSCQHSRRLFHAFALCGAWIRTYIFDRAGGLCSRAFDINHDPKRFLRIIIAYVTMSSEQLGFDPTIRAHPPPDGQSQADHAVYDCTMPWFSDETSQPFITLDVDPQNANQIPSGGLRLADGSQKIVMLLNPAGVLSHRCISSRATTCYPARIATDRDDDTSTWDYFVKFQWRNEERRNEGEFLKKCVGIKQIVNYFYHTDLANLAENVRFNYNKDEVSPVMFPAQDELLSPSTASTPNSTPQLPEEPTDTLTRPSKRPRTGSAQSSKGSIKAPPPLPTTLPKPYNRIQSLLVMAGNGRPLRDASSKHELLTAIRDAIIGHRRLHDEAGLLHRDVSDRNIVISPVGGGWLIDLDFAKALEMPGSVSNAPHRTGTPLFMAIAVLNGSAAHTFRHDLESIFYVVVVMATCYAARGNGLERVKLPWQSSVARWIVQRDYTMLADSKLGAIQSPSRIGDYLAEGWREWRAFRLMLLGWIEALFPIVAPTIQEMDAGMTRGPRTDTVDEQRGGKLYESMLTAIQDVLDA